MRRERRCTPRPSRPPPSRPRLCPRRRYDLDTGVDGDYVEELTVPGYAYVKTPLRPYQRMGRSVSLTPCLPTSLDVF